MQVVKKDIDQLNATLTITIEPSDYEANVAKELKTIRQKANIPGFRPGMVPAGLVKKMYGKSVLGEEVNKAINDGIYNYIKEQKLNILGEPLPNEEATPEINWDNDTTFSFAFDIALAPDFDANLTAKDTIPYYEVEVTDDMVNEQVEKYRSYYGPMVDADKAAEKDVLKGVLTEQKEEGLHKDDAIFSIEYMTADDQKKLFIGAKKGDVITFNPKKAYNNDTELASLLDIKKDEIAEHEGDFTFEITEIKHHELAAIDAELFTKVFGKDAVANEDEFRARIRENFKQQFVADADYKFELDVKAAIMKKLDGIAYPDAFLKRWIKVTNKDITDEKLNEDYPEMLKSLTWDLALNQLIEKYDIKVEKDDVEAYAKKATLMQFRAWGMPEMEDSIVAGYANRMMQDENQLRSIISRVGEEKVCAALKAVVKLNTQSISRTDFDKLFEK